MATMTYLQAISDGLRTEMRADERVLVMGEDIGVFGGAFKVTDGFIDEFGAARVMDTPLAESGIIGTAVGASVVGLRPVCEMQFADFVSCGFDQLVNPRCGFDGRVGHRPPERSTVGEHTSAARAPDGPAGSSAPRGARFGSRELRKARRGGPTRGRTDAQWCQLTRSLLRVVGGGRASAAGDHRRRAAARWRRARLRSRPVG